MRFGSELLRKAEQIFTIIHQAPPDMTCLTLCKVPGVVRGSEPRGVGSLPVRGRRREGENAATLLGSSKDRCP